MGPAGVASDMIDRLLLILPYDVAPTGLIEMLQSRFNRLLEIAPDGSVNWEKPRTSRVRSDDPDVNIRFAAKGVHLWGSPAMVMGTNNVFGSSDIRECATSMLLHASRALECMLPSIEVWQLGGLDITHNYMLEDVRDVKSALSFYGRISNGKLKTTRYPESVYFGMGSRLRTGKIYAKGYQLEKLGKKHDLGLSNWQKAICYNFLRFELCLKSYWFARYLKTHPGWEWLDMTEDDLESIYGEFWADIVGPGGEVELPATDLDMEGRILDAAASLCLSVGLGTAAFKTWCCIQSVGCDNTRYMTSPATWYRHLNILKHAGLTTADFQEGEVLPVRINTIRLGEPVNSWDDVRRRLVA